MIKSGDNLKFICKFIKANPGSRTGEIRAALCRARGKDPVALRGQYTLYFSHLRNGRNYDHLWNKVDGKYSLTPMGEALAA
jgi:hypothetical protein